MLTVGLTGGIGSGKSTVTALLAARGAAVVDADLLAREVVAPGSEGLAEVLAAFGPELALPDGTLDRPALGRLVFGDDAARARLNAIVHPRIGTLTAERMRQAEVSGVEVLVHDVPLLVENGLAGAYEVVVVVAADPQTQVSRLAGRGLTEAEARARIAAQAPLADKLAVATHVIRNDGPRAELEPQVERLWQELVARVRAQR